MVTRGGYLFDVSFNFTSITVKQLTIARTLGREHQGKGERSAHRRECPPCHLERRQALVVVYLVRLVFKRVCVEYGRVRHSSFPWQQIEVHCIR